jgi:hypothetical protein
MGQRRDGRKGKAPERRVAASPRQRGRDNAPKNPKVPVRSAAAKAKPDWWTDQGDEALASSPQPWHDGLSRRRVISRIGVALMIAIIAVVAYLAVTGQL